MVLDSIVASYIGFIEAWNGLATPVAQTLGVEPFVVQFASGLTLMALFPTIASQVGFLRDNLRGSLQLSSVFGLITFFNLYYQRTSGTQPETVWGNLVMDVSSSVVSLTALTVVFLYLTFEFKKWDLIEEITGIEFSE